MGLFDDMVVVVTGSSRGIGKAIAKEFAAEGAKVCITATNLERCKQVLAEIEDAGGTAMVHTCDITKREEVIELFEDVADTFGPVGILVNNAGITHDTSLFKMTEEIFDKIIEADLKSVFLCSQEAARYMVEKKWGRIINMSSTNGVIGAFGQVNYAAAKAGIIGMTKSLCRELGRKGITVNAVAPGLILTDMADKLSEEIKQNYLSKMVLTRLGLPEDVAAAVLFLASERAGFITGTTLHVNGGLYIPA